MMADITKKYFKSIVRIAKSQIIKSGFSGSEKEKIFKFSGRKVLKLIEIIENKGFDQSEEMEMHRVRREEADIPGAQVLDMEAGACHGCRCWTLLLR
jgi:hypothetical protein